MSDQMRNDQLTEELTAIERYERTIAGHQEHIREMQERLQVRRERLQRLVRNGASTGDRVLDYVIAHLEKAKIAHLEGNPRDKALRFFRMIDAGVREHQGQLVLVVTASTRPIELGANLHSVLVEEIALGVIEGEMMFSVTDPKLRIPGSRHVVFESGQSVFYKSMERGPGLPLDQLTWIAFREPLEEHFFGEYDRTTPVLRLDVRFGDMDVAAWFAERGKARLFLLRDLCLKLDYPLPSHEALSAAIEEEREHLIHVIIEDDAELDRLQGIIRSARAPRSETTAAADGLRVCAQRLQDSLHKAEQIGLEHPDVARIRTKAQASAAKTTVA